MQNNRSLEKELGARFSMVCAMKGINIVELADAIGVDVTTVSRFETEGITDVDVLLKIKQYVGVDLLKYKYELSKTEMKALKMLVDSYGYIDTEVFEEFKEKYGCETEDMEQLLAMHFCVREQFTDRNSEWRDGLFLSEVGKNWAMLNCWVDLEHNISYCGADQCTTYEKACDSYEDYQTYVNNNGKEELKDFYEREWVVLIGTALEEADKTEIISEKVALFEKARKLASEKAAEYGFGIPNVLLASMHSIMKELVDCRDDENAFTEELYRAYCMVDGYRVLYGEVKMNPVYRVRLRDKQ